MRDERKQLATFGNLRQRSDELRRSEKEKLKLRKWFTVLKKKNYFMEIKKGFPNQQKMFLV
jgi:hypothetical protein